MNILAHVDALQLAQGLTPLQLAPHPRGLDPLIAPLALHALRIAAMFVCRLLPLLRCTWLSGYLAIYLAIYIPTSIYVSCRNVPNDHRRAWT